jgi:hypothetical protein
MVETITWTTQWWEVTHQEVFHQREYGLMNAPLDPHHDIRRHVYDAFAEGDRLLFETEHLEKPAEMDGIVAGITAQLEKLEELSSQACSLFIETARSA